MVVAVALVGGSLGVGVMYMIPSSNGSEFELICYVHNYECWTCSLVISVFVSVKGLQIPSVIKSILNFTCDVLWSLRNLWSIV